MTTAAALKELAPTGTLRGGVVVAPAASVFFVIEQGGKPRGVTVDLIGAFAEETELPLELKVFPNSGELTAAVARGDCDVAFMPQDAERAKVVDFGPAYYMIESTFLVPAGSTIRTLAEANFKGARAIVIASTTTGRSAARFLTQGSIQEVRSVDDMTAMAKAGDGDLFALSRDSFATLLPALPGARVLDGGFQHTGVASAVPKGRPTALKTFGDFVERAKASGLVRRALDRAGFVDAEVAPPASQS
jgi:polar amino acid transport system substrate-binding protein